MKLSEVPPILEPVQKAIEVEKPYEGLRFIRVLESPVPAPPQKPPAVAGPPTIPSAAVVPNATAVANAGAVQNPAAVPNAAAAPHPVASPAANFLALLSPNRMVSPAAGAEHAKPIEKETEHLNVAVKAFQLLLDRARHNRDVSGQPASFQYTLWCMVLLVVFVTAVGVVLLNSAAQRQRDKLTSTTEPATTCM
ncbi:uncharacterized protein LOC142767793 [Rhipicephalus microplus]|uniref:uncharacterized protein LOC142767793 n=1 Tax=Rhipicephalus microplus TaxID=6941 RepID=UPI003F6D0518